jgi:hypothetical protein
MDFDIASIEVNSATLAWGPYRFNFQGVLPDPAEDPIVSALVKSYLNGAETTAQLIDSFQVESPVIEVWFNYPGTQYHGKHTLVFTLSAQEGGVNSFELGFVDVR